jgi:hypothetical protein
LSSNNADERPRAGRINLHHDVIRNCLRDVAIEAEIMVKSASAAPWTMIGLTVLSTKAAGTAPRACISFSIHAVATPPLAASSTSTRPT